MREIKIMALLAVAFLSGTVRASASECDRLQNATPDQLVSYLNTIVPRQGDASCMAFAIHRLGSQRYEPAITVLTKLLDFHWPLNPQQQQQSSTSSRGGRRIYPAADALKEIGKSSLPSVLEAIKADSTSRTAREAGVSVWMEIYKNESPQGVALLKHEAEQATDTAVKQRLGRAVNEAVFWCKRPDEAQCKTAATR